MSKMIKKITGAIFLLLTLGFPLDVQCQKVSGDANLLEQKDFLFLQELTKDVLESSRIYSGQKITSNLIPNKTGGTVVRPGGRDCYPSFWIRDYAMSLESGFILPEEQKHMLLLTAKTQCNQTWITHGGSMVPTGAIADHITIDGIIPVYFPGTRGVDLQGDKTYGISPPYCDQFFFIIIVKTTSFGGGHV